MLVVIAPRLVTSSLEWGGGRQRIARVAGMFDDAYTNLAMPTNPYESPRHTTSKPSVRPGIERILSKIQPFASVFVFSATATFMFIAMDTEMRSRGLSANLMSLTKLFENPAGWAASVIGVGLVTAGLFAMTQPRFQRIRSEGTPTPLQ